MMRYVPDLPHSLILHATAHTHPFWGRGRALDEHRERVFAQLENAGPEILTYAGLVDEGGELRASFKRYTVALAGLGPEPVRTLGIGAVFTPEAHRGRGYAAAMLREALAEAKQQGLGTALLYSDIDTQFYARLGFVRLPALNWTADTGRLPADGPLELQPASSNDETRLRAWYDASFDADQARPHRDRSLWRYFRWMNGPLEELALCDAGREVGYLSLSEGGPGEVWIDEWAAPGVAPPRLWATARRLAAERGCARVSGWLRADQVGPGFDSASRPTAIPMVALLDDRLSLTSEQVAAAHFGSIDHF